MKYPLDQKKWYSWCKRKLPKRYLHGMEKRVSWACQSSSCAHMWKRYVMLADEIFHLHQKLTLLSFFLNYEMTQVENLENRFCDWFMQVFHKNEKNSSTTSDNKLEVHYHGNESLLTWAWILISELKMLNLVYGNVWWKKLVNRYEKSTRLGMFAREGW